MLRSAQAAHLVDGVRHQRARHEAGPLARADAHRLRAQLRRLRARPAPRRRRRPPGDQRDKRRRPPGGQRRKRRAVVDDVPPGVRDAGRDGTAAAAAVVTLHDPGLARGCCEIRGDVNAVCFAIGTGFVVVILIILECILVYTSS